MTSKTVLKGFGFNPAESEHCFMVSIPSSASDEVWVSEHTKWSEEEFKGKIRAVESTNDERLKVIISREKWDYIADVVKDEFNQRLRQKEQKAWKWKVSGITSVSRLFGKELVLLLWAIEDADPGTIPKAIRNWKGLTPEERWWMFTMTNAATGHALQGKGKGWRKAVRYALTENPISSSFPEQRMGLVKESDDTGSKKRKKINEQEDLSKFF